MGNMRENTLGIVLYVPYRTQRWKYFRVFHGPTLVGRPGVGLGRAGPAHRFFIRWAAVRPGPTIFQRMCRGPAQRMCRGPARPINFSEDGPRPSPAHHIFKNHGPARPGPSFF